MANNFSKHFFVLLLMFCISVNSENQINLKSEAENFKEEDCTQIECRMHI
jgi:hypothetical protein